MYKIQLECTIENKYPFNSASSLKYFSKKEIVELTIFKLLNNRILGLLLLLLIFPNSLCFSHQIKRVSPKIAELRDSNISITLTDSFDVIHPFLSVNAGILPSDLESRKKIANILFDTGVREVLTSDLFKRFDLNGIYPDLKADPENLSSYNFSKSDEVFRFITDNGFEPFLKLGNSFGGCIPSSNIEMKNLINASINILRHYREGKWNGFRKVIRNVEIWNEPDVEKFWPKNLLPFNEFFVLFLNGLQKAFPDIKFGGPGFSPDVLENSKKHNPVRKFLAFLKENGVKPDFLSWHCFPEDPIYFYEKCVLINGFLKSEKMDGVKNYVSAWNVHEIGREGKIDDFKRAALLASCWVVIQDAKISNAVIFRASATAEDFPRSWELISDSGKPTPSSVAFAFLGLLSDCTNRMKLVASDESLNFVSDPTSDRIKPVWMIAGKNPKTGLMRLLISNIGEQKITCSLNIPKVFSFKPVTLKVREISSPTNLIKSSASEKAVFTVNPWSVTLVDIE
ncbi:MAG: hypothetical protein HQM08_12270 [Candidatus Riflebacteria bacterium]|nr:hypothetical protein [Candidatus Riflebacteria bacterium]